MDLEFPRGDTKQILIDLTDKNGDRFKLRGEDMLYMTVKRNSRDTEYIFQKKLGNGIKENEDGKYEVTILPSDTNALEYGTYGYDIQIKSGNNVVKTLGIWSITLTEEYTHSVNE